MGDNEQYSCSKGTSRPALQLGYSTSPMLYKSQLHATESLLLLSPDTLPDSASDRQTQPHISSNNATPYAPSNPTAHCEAVSRDNASNFSKADPASYCCTNNS